LPEVRLGRKPNAERPEITCMTCGMKFESQTTLSEHRQLYHPWLCRRMSSVVERQGQEKQTLEFKSEEGRFI